MRRRYTLFFVVFSSILQAATFPVAGPLPEWRAALAFISLVPWLFVLFQQKSILRQTLLSYLCGALWYLGTCYWVYSTMHLYGDMNAAMSASILMLFCLYLGLYHALFGFLIASLRSRLPDPYVWLSAPVVWVAVELARARVTSFPWNLLGYSQIDNHLLTRLAPWTGVYGIGLLVVACNAAIAFGLSHRKCQGARLVFAAGIASSTAVVVCGIPLRPPMDEASRSAVLMQPNLSFSQPLDTPGRLAGRLKALTLNPIPPLTNAKRPWVKTATPQIVLWPESPSSMWSSDPEVKRAIFDLASQEHAPVIAGVLGHDATDRVRLPYNSAILVAPAIGYIARYDKIHLVPFGEFVPYESLLSFAGGLTQAVGTVARGTSREPLRINTHKFGVFLCYESIFADEVRWFVLNGADVLVNLSDDGWYGDTSAPFQHLNMARMRAIENDRWLLRDTNNGVTAAIDPQGRIVEWMPRHIRSAISVHFDYRKRITFYTQHGDLFAYLCAALTSALYGFGGLQILAAAGNRHKAEP